MTVKWDYHRREIEDVLHAGPHEGDDSFRMQIQGTASTKWLSVTPEQLEAIKLVLDVTNPPTLLPMMNRSRVLRADTWFTRDGVGEGYVLAQTRDDQFVTWHVYLHKGEVRWLAETGEYHRDFDAALVDYQRRRGIVAVAEPSRLVDDWGCQQVGYHLAATRHTKAECSMKEGI